METPLKSVIGGGLVSVLAIGGAALAGVAADPVAPPARAATGLSTFADCAALRSWYVEHTLDQVTAYGWGGHAFTTMRTEAPLAAETSATGEAVTNGSTGTNTQEAGVDEPDVAKTDRRVVVRLVDGERVVIADVTGSAPHQVADWRIPSGTYADGLLLVGDHVLVSGTRRDAVDQEGGISPKVGRVMMGGPAETEVIDLDLADPSHPRLDSRTTWSGQQLSMRQYGDTVRLVTSTGLPRLPFVQPRPGRLSADQAEAHNREVVRHSTVRDWLPRSSAGSLLGCDQVFHPRTWSGADTVAVATFRPGHLGDATAVAVTGAGDDVYSTTDRLYVTSDDVGGRRTHLHAFALDGASTRYVASGTVDGTIRDRWSLDEYDGHLRVAVSWPTRVGTTRDNGIVVLDERDGRLHQVGELRGLGPDETIQSVRWFDDLAVVVTFRQMDPLHTVDLSDPTEPRKLGELSVPGFFAYLHPIGDDRLLGLGSDATTDGHDLGAQAGVFDLGDLTAPRQLSTVTFGPETELGVSDDPHDFTWLPDSSVAITSLQRWSTTDTQMVLLRVSTDGTLTRENLPSPGGDQVRALPLDHGRVALVGSTVRIVDLGR